MNYIANFLSGLKSRTVWTVIALVLLNGVPAVRDSLPAGWLPYVDSLLGLLAWHFRVNPRAEFDPPA